MTPDTAKQSAYDTAEHEAAWAPDTGISTKIALTYPPRRQESGYTATIHNPID